MVMMAINDHIIYLQAVCGLFSMKIPSRPKNSGNVSMKSSTQTVLCQMPTICTAERIMPWAKKRVIYRSHFSLVVVHIL